MQIFFYCCFFGCSKNIFISYFHLCLFNQLYFYLFYIFFFYFGILTTCIPKIHSIFFFISNVSEEIIYKITQIKIVKRTISLLHVQYFLFLQYNVSIQKFKSFLFYDQIFQIFIYTNSYNVE
jgi:hypothetical protein